MILDRGSLCRCLSGPRHISVELKKKTPHHVVPGSNGAYSTLIRFIRGSSFLPLLFIIYYRASLHLPP